MYLMALLVVSLLDITETKRRQKKCGTMDFITLETLHGWTRTATTGMLVEWMTLLRVVDTVSDHLRLKAS